MMRFPALLSRIALLACALLAAATPARADVKALLLATDYAEAADSRLQLDNPIADGRMIAAALRRTTVDEIELVEEPDAVRWGTAFEDFAASLSGDDIAFVYFAGHGFQIDGANYLLAADGHSLIGLDAMLRRLTGEARGVVFVVDACRNNPLIEADRSTEMEIVAVEGAQRALDTVTLDDIVFSNRGLAQVGSLRGLRRWCSSQPNRAMLPRTGRRRARAVRSRSNLLVRSAAASRWTRLSARLLLR